MVMQLVPLLSKLKYEFGSLIRVKPVHVSPEVITLYCLFKRQATSKTAYKPWENGNQHLKIKEATTRRERCIFNQIWVVITWAKLSWLLKANHYHINVNDCVNYNSSTMRGFLTQRTKKKGISNQKLLKGKARIE